MRKQTPPQDFEIHVDPSCLSEDFKQDMENDMSTERVASSQTVVHHDSWGEGEAEKPVVVEVVEAETEQNHEQENAVLEHSEDKERQPRERQIDRIEAEIKKAAAQVVASIESDNFPGPNDSVLSTQTDESYEPEALHEGMNGTELAYGDSTEATFESDNEVAEFDNEVVEETAGDSSSQHDGDIDDDVFSNSSQSKRSSLNSALDLSSDEKHKHLTSPFVGEEAASSIADPISPVPSGISFMQLPTDLDATPRTPSKILSRPPFRTPSSVRAMQMSSPTPSIFSSPRSVKRHLPTVSRIGTPTAQKRTPTRLKPRKPDPLVLLHVTLLPLQWSYAHLITSPTLPSSLQGIKSTFRLLQEKLGDTVLERGVLLAHPQDSYEVLEERLLEALELPVRPRARILKCGHYMGPETDDEDGGKSYGRGSGWCDICHREIRVEEVGEVEKGEKRFRIKIYASNGLMRAGAWGAAWREMERVDVEIEPFVDSGLQGGLDALSVMQRSSPANEQEEHDDGFEDEEIVVEHVHEHQHEKSEEELTLEAELRQHVEKEEAREKESLRQKSQEEEAERKALEEERMREVYGQQLPTLIPEPRRARRNINEDSLSELLVAAFKVAMQDTRNVVIVVLAAVALYLALSRGSSPPTPVSQAPVSSVETAAVSQLSNSSIEPVTATSTVIHQLTVTETQTVPAPTAVEIVVQERAEAGIPLPTNAVEEVGHSTSVVEEFEPSSTSSATLEEITSTAESLTPPLPTIEVEPEADSPALEDDVEPLSPEAEQNGEKDEL